jgi:DNA invertase Pin-like site-specific DNA recombinase
VYEDRASGGRDDRPGLKACLEYLTSGDGLVVRRLDRLGRSLPRLVGIVAELRARGVGLRSLSETIDTTTATGELVFHPFASLARHERALVRERVAGLEAARRRGRRGGRMLDAERGRAAKVPLAEGRSLAAAARVTGVPRSTPADARGPRRTPRGDIGSRAGAVASPTFASVACARPAPPPASP